MKNQIKFLRHFVLYLFIELLSVNAQWNISNVFCSSQCADYIQACFGQGESDCFACSQSIYELQRNSSGVCQLKEQTQILFYQLKNSGVSLAGYHSSKPTPFLCDTYYLSGQYVAGDFLQKTFDNIPKNHYQLVIRFGIAHLGNWTQSDELQLTVDGHTEAWMYRYCQDDFNTTLCVSDEDCIKVKQRIISHNSSNVTIRFTSSIAETDPNVKSWGIKDLLIAARLCHSRCLTCFGPNSSDCITCAENYFLLGNLCVQKCEFYALTDKRICVESCPLGYFASGNNICSPCQPNCFVCTNSNSCDVWSAEKPGVVWENNKTFFIILIFVLLLVIAFFLWKLVLKKFLKRKDLNEHQELNKRMISDNSLEERDAKAEALKVKSNSNGSIKEDENQDDQDNIQEIKFNSKVQESNDTKALVFEENALEWNQEIPQIPTIEQLITSNTSNVQKKKKKRFRPNTIQNSATYPSSFEFDGTNLDLNL